MFSLVVNREITLWEMILEGKYDDVNKDIMSGYFPSIQGSGSEEVHLELINLIHFVEFDEAVREVRKRGFRPADIAELLSFGAKYPDEQRKYPIAALGSVAKAETSGGTELNLTPQLTGEGESRFLCLEWDDWGPETRFLVVRL